MINGKRIAVLLLGGSGVRFGGQTPKQLVPVQGKPLFWYPLEKLDESPLIDWILLVIREDLDQEIKSDVAKHFFEKPISYVVGGNSRTESVRHAIAFLREKEVSDDSLILIHDGDRPNISPFLIEEGFKKAEEFGASVTALPCSDSVFMSEDLQTVSSYQARSKTFLAQTPQTFRFSILKNLPFAENFTDEAGQVSSSGHKIAIVKGNPGNYKINYPADLRRFERELKI